MKWLGRAIALLGLFFILMAVVEPGDQIGWVCMGLGTVFVGLNVQFWSIKDIGQERIVIEPSPTPGFNAWYERRTLTGWHRNFDLSGWGSTQHGAENSCKLKVAEHKAEIERINSTPTKVVDL